MKTNQQLWTALRADWATNNPQWVETSEDYYSQMLGAVPPLYMGCGIFAMGEAECHDKNGMPVHAWFLKREGKYYAKLAAWPDLRKVLFTHFVNKLLTE